MFMRNKPLKKISERKRKSQRVMAMVLIAVLAGSWLLFPMSLYGRSCLYWDGSIIQYNVFNKEKRQFSTGQIESVEIEAYRYTSGKARHKHWGVRVNLVTDTGKDYTYPIDSFRDDDQAETAYWLTAMIRLKERYDPGIIYLKGKENLAEVIEDKNLSAQEIALLYQLFELQ